MLRPTVLIAFLVAVCSGGVVLMVPAQPPQVADTEQALMELERYKQEVTAAREKAQADVDRLVSAAAGNEQASALLRESLGSSPSTIDPQAGLFAGQLREIDNWISLMRNHGTVDTVFRDQTRQAMESWRNSERDFRQALAALERELNALRSSSVPQWCVGSDTLFCNEARGRARERLDAADHAATDVRRRFRAGPVPATLDGPAPPPTACGDARPVALKIVTGRDSAPVNEHIQVDIAVVSASDRGAVVAQDEEVIVETTQDDLSTRTTVRIQRGSCSNRTKVSPTKPGDMQIRARSETGRLKAAQRPALGCGTTPITSMKLSMDTKGSGVADGVAPIEFSYKFFDKTDQLTTGGRRKDLVISHQGVGVRANVDKSAATDWVPVDQCVSRQELRSTYVGEAVIEASSGGLTAKRGDFTFAFPVTIALYVSVVGCALVPSIAVSLPKGRPKDPRPVRFVKHFSAGLIVAGVAYVALLRFMPRPSVAQAWFVLICLGSVLGALLGVWILKVIVEAVTKTKPNPDR